MLQCLRQYVLSSGAPSAIRASFFPATSCVIVLQMEARTAPPWHPAPVAGLGQFFRRALDDRARVLGSMLLDSVLVVLAALLNYGVEHVVDGMDLHGIDKIVVVGLQWLLGLGTLGVTLAFLFGDLYRAVRRALSDDDED